MAFIPVPDGIKCVMRFSKASQQVCNVFYVTTPDTVDDTLLDTLGSTLYNWWYANGRLLQSNDVALQAIELTDVSVEGGLGIEYTTLLPANAIGGVDYLPNNVTLAIKLSSGMTGRSNRGRQYWIGIKQNQLASDYNHITTTFQTAIKGAYDSLISDLVSAGFTLVIASLYSGVDGDGKPIPRTTGVTHEVASVVVNATIDSQRRRLPERGA